MAEAHPDPAADDLGEDAAPEGAPASHPDPGDRSQDPSPHHALNVPVGEPDPTEWPDPYDRREDPRAPGDGMFFGAGDEPRPEPGSVSTSEPHPAQDPEAVDWEGPKRDRLDE